MPGTRAVSGDGKGKPLSAGEQEEEGGMALH